MTVLKMLVLGCTTKYAAVEGRDDDDDDTVAFGA